MGVGLNIVAMVCWVFIFLAGTDVWHDTGSRDFWHLPGPPYQDLRVIAYTFYALFFVLVFSLIVLIATLRRKKENPS
jgi:hypothetical protein